MSQIPMLPGHDFAHGYGINDDGWVVGQTGILPISVPGHDTYPNGYNAGFVYQNGITTEIVNVNFTGDVNNHGLVVGTLIGAGSIYGFVYSEGSILHQSPFSEFDAINDRNHINQWC